MSIRFFPLGSLFAAAMLAPWPAAWAGDDVALGGLGGQGSQGDSRPSCIEVEIDGQKAPDMTCLNQELQQKAAAAAHAPPVAPVGAGSPALQTGGFNQAAVAQQYGQNFGKSAQPYRPPAPVYAPPLGGH